MMAWPEQSAFERALLDDLHKDDSSSKIVALARMATKHLKYHKLVVHSVEKFIKNAEEKQKVYGLYVMDAILKHSQVRHKDKDMFPGRFEQNLQQSFMYIMQCPEYDKKQVKRIVTSWKERKVFSAKVLHKLDKALDGVNAQTASAGSVATNSPTLSPSARTPSPPHDLPMPRYPPYLRQPVSNSGEPFPKRQAIGNIASSPSGLHPHQAAHVPNQQLARSSQQSFETGMQPHFLPLSSHHLPNQQMPYGAGNVPNFQSQQQSPAHLGRMSAAMDRHVPRQQPFGLTPHAAGQQHVLSGGQSSLSSTRPPAAQASQQITMPSTLPVQQSNIMQSLNVIGSSTPDSAMGNQGSHRPATISEASKIEVDDFDYGDEVDEDPEDRKKRQHKQLEEQAKRLQQAPIVTSTPNVGLPVSTITPLNPSRSGVTFGGAVSMSRQQTQMPNALQPGIVSFGLHS